MHPTEIIFVYRPSRLEVDQYTHNLSISEVISLYKREGVDYDKILKSHERDLIARQEIKKVFPEADIVPSCIFTPELSLPKKLTVSVGGDESFKKVAHLSRTPYITSIVSDVIRSEGALACCSIDHLELFRNHLLNESYIVEKWHKTEVIINDTFVYTAIDTVYVGNKSSFLISKYVLKYKDLIEEQRSSGIIISTGAGSTGWFKAAGGTPFSRTAKYSKFIVREPYTGRIYKAKITKGTIDQKTNLEIISLMHKNQGIINIDSIISHNFEAGFKVIIRTSKRSINFIRIRL